MALRKRRNTKKAQEAIRKSEAKLSNAIDISPEIDPLWRDPIQKSVGGGHITIDQVVYATRVSHGIPVFAARFLGVSRSKYIHYVKHNSRVAQVAKNERESIIDIAEGRLFEALAEGYSWAIKYVLDNLGKDRGWTTEIIKADRTGELLKSIENMVGMDKEELEAYDEEQVQYEYDKRTNYEVNVMK